MPLSTVRHIPFNRPLTVGSEMQTIADLITRSRGVDPAYYTLVSQARLREVTASPLVYLTPSCTQSLEMATLITGIRPGDEVIMPAFTFVSTANAVVLRGATPVFVDIRPDTCNLDASLIQQAITPRTRAIIPVHYAGVACEMDAIMSIAQDADLVVIEDAAHAVLANWRGRALGSIGHFGTYSFHSTKNLTSGGEGGALLINTPEHAEQAEIARANGTNRAAFMRGEVPCYEWISPGGNYNMSELQAAVLWTQLQMAEAITNSRRDAWGYYYHQLHSVCEAKGVVLPTVPQDCQHNAHIFYLLMPTMEVRQQVRGMLAEAGIEAPSHYEPLHRSPAGSALSRFVGSDQHTVRIASTMIRLPLYHGISRDDQDYVIETLIRALELTGL